MHLNIRATKRNLSPTKCHMPCDVTALLSDVTAEGGVYIAEIRNWRHRTTISVFGATTSLSAMKTIVSLENCICVLKISCDSTPPLHKL